MWRESEGKGCGRRVRGRGKWRESEGKRCGEIMVLMGWGKTVSLINSCFPLVN